MRVLLLAAAAAVAIAGGTSIASAQTYKAAMAASNNTFDDVVKADIAKGYYTQAQGDELLRQGDASLVRLDEATTKAASRITKTITLASSGSLRDVVGQVGVMLDRNGGFTMGGTDSQVREQSAAIYNAIDAQLQTSIAIQEDLRPMLNEYGAELDRIVAARAALILASPNASTTDKGKVRSESARVSDIVKNSLERSLQANLYKIETVRDQLQARRDVVIANISGDIRRNAAEYGSDPKKWPKPSPPGSSSAANGGTRSPGGTRAPGSASGTGSGSPSGQSGGTTRQSGGTQGSSMSATAGRTTGAGSTDGTGYGSGTPSTTTGDGTDEEAGTQEDYWSKITYNRDTGLWTETSYIPANGELKIRTRTWQGTPIGYDSQSTYSSPAGYSNLIGTGPSASDGSYTIAQLRAMLPPNITIPADFGGPYTNGDLNGGSFATVYRGYIVRTGDNGSTVVLVPSSQVERPSSVMTAPSNQIQVPSGMIAMPSNQITMPGSQITVPSAQVRTPGSAMNSLDLQPALCGR